MRIDELFSDCLKHTFQTKTSEHFLRDQIRDLAVDISRTDDPNVTELALVMIDRLGDRLQGRSDRPHRLNTLVYRTLLSWFYPTDDQLLASMPQLSWHRARSHRIQFEGLPSHQARHFIVSTEDHRDQNGTLWPQGALIPTVHGDLRISYLKLAYDSYVVLEQDNMKDNSVLLERD